MTTDTHHHEPDCRPGEDIFKCRSCGERYGHCMASTDDVSVCRWCSGEEE
jgi:hypothetical protein